MGKKKEKQFKPTEQMIKLVEARLSPEIAPTITAECKYAGISRQTYYNWFDNEEFVNWYSREFEKGMGKMMSWLDKVGLMKSTKDFRYWEALQMKYAKYSKRMSVEADVKVEPLIDLEKEISEIRKSLRKPGTVKKGNKKTSK